MIPLANHLWQSTWFAAGIAVLCLLLRRHRAAVRYGLWLTASLKFLVPFGALVSVGSELEAPAVIPQEAPVVVREFSLPLTPVRTLPPVEGTGAGLLDSVVIAIWAGGALLVACVWLVRWRRVARAARASVAIDVDAPVAVRETKEPLEPGVFGIVRPVLLLPAGLPARLHPEQLRAVLAHELCHVRRRDNLTAALHMAVQSIFWFHPLVWWIGKKLVEERELACDESVLELGSQPEVYANGILSVCRFYLESPVACVSGVGGADLKKRVRLILEGSRSRRLSRGWRLALASGGAAAVLAPLMAGLVQHPVERLKFEVASIRESKAASDNSRIGPGPGGALQASNVTLKQLITFAYDIHDFQLEGAPGWVSDARFDVLAKPEEAEALPDPKKTTIPEMESMIGRHRERMRSLLAERFSLAVRREKKNAPVYTLTVARGGHKMSEVAAGSKPPSMRTGRGTSVGTAVNVEMIANALSRYVERQVLDQTGLKGVYDFEFHWSPEGAAGAEGPALFTALQEQLGLKLESRRAPLPLLIVERVERPTAN